MYNREEKTTDVVRHQIKIWSCMKLVPYSSVDIHNMFTELPSFGCYHIQ